MAERRESREALEAQAESPSSPGLWQSHRGWLYRHRNCISLNPPDALADHQPSTMVTSQEPESLKWDVGRSIPTTWPQSPLVKQWWPEERRAGHDRP